jgi:uncharacterized alkaline shock family protein YloU
MYTVREEVSAPVDQIVLARAALAAASGVAGVRGISRGRYTVARSFGDGGAMVEGVQLTPAPQGMAIEIHLLISPVPIPALAEAVRQQVGAALQLLGTAVTTVDVWIDGLVAEATTEAER